MGSLTYDRLVVDVDDRTLSHVQIVIIQKLRRGESFLLSWKDAMDDGGGRSSVWLHPSIPLYFKFSGGHPPTMNPQWLDYLTQCASSPRGLVITGEDAALCAGNRDGDRAPRLSRTFRVHPAPQTARKTMAVES